MTETQLLRIAYLAHEINRAYCESLGDYSQPVWSDLPNPEKYQHALEVEHYLLSEPMTPEAAHASWMQSRLAEGWSYGIEKDPVLKTHPSLVLFQELSPEEMTKDYLYDTAVRLGALRELKENL